MKPAHMRHCRLFMACAAMALALGAAVSATGAEPAPKGATGQGREGPASPPAAPDKGPAAPAKRDPTAPPPTIPRTAPSDDSAQPTRGQGTVNGSRANPASDGRIPGGRAGSGGGKSNAFGR